MIRRETWIVLGVFLLALAGLFLWQRYGSGSGEVEETPEAAAVDSGGTLFDLQGAPLQSVSIERTGEKTVELQRDPSGAWQVVRPAGFQADSAALETSLGQLSAVPVIEKMQNAPSLEAMGLASPRYRLLVGASDGRQVYADIGDETPTGSGYYVLSSDRSVYIVNNFSLEPILGLIDNLPPAVTVTPAETGASMPETTPVPGTEPAELLTPAGTP